MQASGLMNVIFKVAIFLFAAFVIVLYRIYHNVKEMSN